MYGFYVLVTVSFELQWLSLVCNPDHNFDKFGLPGNLTGLQQTMNPKLTGERALQTAVWICRLSSNETGMDMEVAAGTGMTPNEYTERFVQDGTQAAATEVDGDDTERTAKPKTGA
jgi:hypothetical protein